MGVFLSSLRSLYTTDFDELMTAEELEVQFSDLDQRAASLRSVLDGITLEKKTPAEHAQTGCFDNWLTVVDAYRTVCIVPSHEVRAVFDAYRDLHAAIKWETGHP